MRSRGSLVFLAVFGLIALAMADVRGQVPRERPTLAVLAFEIKPAGRVLPPPNLGAAMTDWMIARLVASDEYRVLDGRWLEDDEHGMDPRDQIDAARKHAKSAGVDFLVIGSMTRFSTEERQRTIGGVIPLPLIAGLRGRKTTLAVAVTVRVVNVRTGEIATVATAQGLSSRRNVAAGGLLRGPGGGIYSKA